MGARERVPASDFVMELLEHAAELQARLGESFIEHGIFDRMAQRGGFGFLPETYVRVLTHPIVPAEPRQWSTAPGMSTHDSLLMLLIELRIFVFFAIDVVMKRNFGKDLAYLLREGVKAQCLACGWSEPGVRQLETLLDERFASYAAAWDSAAEHDEALQRLGDTAAGIITGLEDPAAQWIFSIHWDHIVRDWRDLAQTIEVAWEA